MGAIQPARFLTHSGKILPGVRRIVHVPNPAAGADWQTVVPAGVQWRILSGIATLTTSAAAGNRGATSTVIVDGVLIWNGHSSAFTAGSTAQVYPIVVGGANEQTYITNGVESLWYQDVFYPQGSVIGTSTSSINVADQWSAISLWVEEVYFTDSQLSTIETLREADERSYLQELEKEYAQQGGGN